MKKILFILKDRVYSPSKTSYGLINSASNLATFLTELGNECKLVTVFDANFIDKEVYQYKPDIVVIEAIWVPTYKMEELLEMDRYKDIKWVVRVHSDIGYLSVETNSLKTINEYIGLQKDNLIVSFNNKEFVNSVSEALVYNFDYLPNVITILDSENNYSTERDYMHVGCFGAMRSLKNQCFQAICAIKAANKLKKTLYFHVSPNLCEKHNPYLTNLIELFRYNEHRLVIHDWMQNDEFHEVIRTMDIGMQLSYTESFNIVTADFVNNNKLIVVSDAIDWMPGFMKTSTTDYDKVTNEIVFLYKNRNNRYFKQACRYYLNKYNKNAKKEWIKFLNKI